jgi:3-carboxy-cis,cis-muconate cycloisomerase
MSIYSYFFYSIEANEIFSEKSTLKSLLKVEAALAKAQANQKLFKIDYAVSIEKCCKTENFDLEQLKKEVVLGGNIAIPLVKQLTKQVKLIDFEASKYVHLGATSQDIIDTATVLQIKDFVNYVKNKSTLLISELADKANTHKTTIMIGRTLLQQAKPITFGLKICTWIEALTRSLSRINEMESRLYSIQLGGAVGSENSNLNIEIKEEFARILGLKNGNSWAANRDNFAELASNLGILSGTIGKLTTDLLLMMQTEVGEILEGEGLGKGGSSTMPHKRNPVTATAILANCNRIPNLVGNMLALMPQQHERSPGLWHAEWDLLTEIMQLIGGILDKSIDLIENLEVNQQKMLDNLEITKGLIFAENAAFALAPKIGKINAHEYVEKACKLAIASGKHLKEILAENSDIQPYINDIFDPKNAIGNSVIIVEEILKKYKTYTNDKI